jgi:hypothetical protein
MDKGYFLLSKLLRFTLLENESAIFENGIVKTLTDA